MERHWDAASRGENSAPAGDGSVVSRQSFCDYLVSARKQRGLTINDIATVTRIPVRSLERLESGLFEELPADVFVRGFLRSYARCVGLNAEETIRRYTHCGMAPAPVSSVVAGELTGELAGDLVNVPAAAADDVRQVTSKPQRRSHTADEHLAKEMSAQQAALAAPEPVARTERGTGPVAEQLLDGGDGIAAGEVSEPRRKRKRRKRKPRRDGLTAAVQSSVDTASEVSGDASSDASSDASGPQPVHHIETAAEPGQTLTAEGPVQIAAAADAEVAPARAVMSASAAVVASVSAQPAVARAQVRIPSAPALPARRMRASTVTARPVLSIDDEHPEEAERSQEERVERSDASWRSFLPPSLLDSDDGSHRGTLTLAVIILVIVATLTMSYLLRRPNVSGDGVTWQAPAPGEMFSSRRLG